MPALTIGMAHINDYDGAYFTIQAIRMANPGLAKDLEFIVVDGQPNSPSSQPLKTLLDGWVRPHVGEARYIPHPEPQGTSATRNRVFTEASSPWVMVMDCHVLLRPGTIEAALAYAAENPLSNDIISGPLVLDSLADFATHFNPVWRGEMWGTWGQAWECGCEGGIAFSPTETPHPEGDRMVPRMLNIDAVPVTKCGGCGAPIPNDIPWSGHDRVLMDAGFRRKGLNSNEPPFEVPGHGLGMFLMRRDAWPGFNPHARGFGGEELYIHEKVRAAGGRALCHPRLQWLHRFGRPTGVPYVISAWNKVRNYVLEFQELGRDLDPIYDHFVATGIVPEENWQHLLKDPVRHATEPQACQTCGGGLPEDSVLEADTIEDVFEAVRSIPRDLDKHMPTLAKYAARVNTAAEVSKRRESTIALLHGIPSGGMVHSHQVERSPVLDRMPNMAEAEGKGWTKTVEDSSGMEGIEPCELLFIDSTEHTAARLRAELDKFAPNVSRWIIIHDTKLHANNGEDGGPGYLEAMRGFMRDHPQWSVLEHTDRQYGLTVLGCQRADKPKPPSIIKMGVNFAKAVAEHVASGGEKVTVAQLKERLAVCTLCPLRRDARCSACGCNIEAKAAMATQDCPMGKWPYIVDGVTMDDRDLAADHDVVIENE